MRSSQSVKLDIENIFCVGEKTKDFIEQNIGKVKCWKKNSKELALELAKIIPGQKVTYFCSDIRLDTLPGYLSQNSIAVKEIKSYSTIFTPSSLNQNFSAVLFF
jgi:uroporphyrinogen-III synthase